MFKYLIQIRYKSGHMIEEWFTEIEFRKTETGDGLEQTSMSYKLFNPDSKFVYIGLLDIESIFIVKKEKYE